ncbi:MAG: hypothetical protein FJY66_05905 [Calditrichaeota bacterium]|nr:hypothetical protein [Calditrichota bacterium]
MRRIIILVFSIALLASPVLGAEKRTSSERGSAFLKSLVVPGWGQWSAGHKTSATFFAMGELAFLGGMYAFHSYGTARRSDYKSYAAQHAGVVGDHPHDFYVDVGNWDRVEDYNEQRLKDREFDQLYTSASDQWEWDSYEHRIRMKKIRVQSDKALNAVYYLVGGIALNHIASAIHAGRTAPARKETSSANSDWHLFFAPVSDRPGLSVYLNCRF